MDADRRKFLIGLGSAALFGVGAAAGLTRVGAAEAPAGEAAQGAIRWGMLVDMTRCAEGCADCIAACNAKHNIPQFGNTKDEIKWIWKQDFAQVFPNGNPFPSARQTAGPVLTLCNHCANPPCVRVCPTQATFKRADGIVEMDFHRCIGCRFCMAACPYGSRSFNWRDPRPFIPAFDPDYPTREAGVVEKCNFCSERLDRGQRPACVEACKAQALVFGNLNDPGSELRGQLRARVTLQRKPELGTQPSVFYAFEPRHD
jgi:molybdopterin-containing oxidoreductase family iron-sulfur binding subunit